MRQLNTSRLLFSSAFLLILLVVTLILLIMTAAAQPVEASPAAFAGLTDSDLRQSLDDAGVAYADAATRVELIRLLQQYESASGNDAAASGRGGKPGAAAAPRGKGASGRGHVLLAQICVG